MVESPMTVELFCGAGGFSLGFKRAGFDQAIAVDRSESALDTYRHNFPDVTTFEKDVRNFNSDDLESETGHTPDEVDVVIGGPPCKGFSTAGRMDPEDPRNELIVEYAKTVGELDPEVVVLENVTGLLGMENGKYIEQLTESLSTQGYSVQEPNVLTAADYGVPQLRERVILFATKGESIDVPDPTHRPHSGESIQEYEDGLPRYITVEDALSDLAFLKCGQKESEYQVKTNTRYQNEMRKGSDVIYNHKAPNHGETVRNRYDQFDHGQEMSDLEEKYQTKKHSMLRFHPNEPAPTVTTLPEDFVHYERNRIPTVREIARLQSFPDWFEFKGPRTTGGSRRRNTVPQYTQVGNAVPPKFAEAIGEVVLRSFTQRTSIAET